MHFYDIFSRGGRLTKCLISNFIQCFSIVKFNFEDVLTNAIFIKPVFGTPILDFFLHYKVKKSYCRKTLENIPIRCVSTREFQIWCYFFDMTTFTPVFGYSKKSKIQKDYFLEYILYPKNFEGQFCNEYGKENQYVTFQKIKILDFWLLWVAKNGSKCGHIEKITPDL